METPLDSNSVYCWKIPLPLSFEIFSACAPRDSSQTFDFEGAGRIQLGLIQRRSGQRVRCANCGTELGQARRLLPALVPAFWSVEVLNSLLVGERRGRITPEDTRTFLNQLADLEPMIDQAPASSPPFKRGRRDARRGSIAPAPRISKALEEAVHDELPGTAIDRVQLFRAFIGAVRRKCSTWESVPDQYVEVDDR